MCCQCCYATELPCSACKWNTRSGFCHLQREEKDLAMAGASGSSFRRHREAHAREALAAFWNTHEAKLQADMKEVVNEHTLSLDGFVPKAGKRICRDQHRHELPALPPAESTDTQPATTEAGSV